MSVEKYIVSKESSNFTIVSNKVIQGLKSHTELLGFYVYLLSLPPQWTFYKTELKQTVGLGIKKLEKFLSLLAQMNLIEVAQMRNENGKFAHSDLRILNGDSFKIIDLDACAPRVNIRTTVNGGTDMGSYKRNINKINNKKDISKSLCATDVAQDPPPNLSFENFWQSYPRKKDKKRTYALWVSRKLDNQAPKIIDDVNNRVRNDSQWQDQQYIPHPSTYLRNELWNDEVELKRMQPKKETSVELAYRMCLGATN